MIVGTRSQLLFPAALVAVCFLPLGCSNSEGRPEVYPVSGAVFLNGEPAAGAQIHFHPVDGDERAPAFGVVQEDGSFELSTFGTNDGAEAGDYVVTLNWRDEEKLDDEIVNGPDRFGERYSKRDKSKLTATIVEGENVLPPFDLKE
jgi:hypothetical protein